MAKEGARKTSKAKVVCMVPDVCLTPAGPAQVPVPYPIVADFNDSAKTSKNVRFAGDPAFLCDQSTITKVTGDQAGTSKGIVSGTMGDKAEPILGSTSVKVNGKPVIRDGDMFKMNNGNTIGMVVYQTGGAPACSVNAEGKPAEEPNPPPEPETEEEKGFLDKLGDWAKDKASKAFKAIKNPVDGVIGAAKGIANIAPAVGEIIIKGSMMNAALDMQKSAGNQALMGNDAAAAETMKSSQEMMDASNEVDLPEFEMANDAQEGGDVIATAAGIVTGGVGLAKGGLKGGAKNLGKMAGKNAKTEAKAAAKVEKVVLEETEEALGKGVNGVKISKTKFLGDVFDGIKAERVCERGKKVAVIGRPMPRVRSYAKNLQKQYGDEVTVEIYDGAISEGGQISDDAIREWNKMKDSGVKLEPNEFKKLGMHKENEAWVNRIKNDPEYTIIDIGEHVDKAQKGASVSYEMEKDVLKGLKWLK